MEVMLLAGAGSGSGLEMAFYSPAGRSGLDRAAQALHVGHRASGSLQPRVPSAKRLRPISVEAGLSYWRVWVAMVVVLLLKSSRGCPQGAC